MIHSPAKTGGEEAGANYAAARQRLGFAITPTSHVRRELIGRPAPVAGMAETVPLAYCPVSLIGPPSWRVLLRLVALKHGVGPQDILSPNRRVVVAAARHELASKMDSHCRLSLSAIGRLLNRDHTTIINSIRIYRSGRKNQSLKASRHV